MYTEVRVSAAQGRVQCGIGIRVLAKVAGLGCLQLKETLKVETLRPQAALYTKKLTIRVSAAEGRVQCGIGIRVLAKVAGLGCLQLKETLKVETLRPQAALYTNNL